MKAKKYKNRLTDRICWTSVPFPAALRTEPIKFLFENILKYVHLNFRRFGEVGAQSHLIR